MPVLDLSLCESALSKPFCPEITQENGVRSPISLLSEVIRVVSEAFTFIMLVND